MPDITATSETLKIENLFVDGDTRTITLKNPRTGITSQDIRDLESFMQANSIIIGDKYSGTFGKIGSVTKVTENKTYLDLNNS